MSDQPEAMRAAVLEAALVHVPFDGWSETTLNAAMADTGVAPGLARALFPRGGIDLAVAYHKAGDDAMLERLEETDLSALRFRDRIASAVRFRLEAADREAVRRGSALFALPQHGPEGARLIWGTADAIWRALGDRSDDINWYSKRATLSGVYGATVLYWLGDDSPGAEATWAFLDRRVEDVMRIENAKAKVRESKVLSRIFAGPMWLAGKVKAPQELPEGLPGIVHRGVGQ